jgi:hypothetical protein
VPITRASLTASETDLDQQYHDSTLHLPERAELAGKSGGGHDTPGPSSHAVAVPHPMRPGGMMMSGNTPN